MSDFWKSRIGNKMILQYSLAPFLESAGILFLSAELLWHRWSIQRLEEIKGLAFKLQQDGAVKLRQCGLEWACALKNFDDVALRLRASAYYRYREDSDKNVIACPEGTTHLVSAAVQLLFAIFPLFEKIDETSHVKKGGWVTWCSKILETCMEAPYLKSLKELSPDALNALKLNAIFLECEGLAHIQATIEDSFYFKHEKTNPKAKKKKHDFSNADLHKMAQEMDVEFGVLKEAFETDYSSWWDEAQKYRDLATTQKELFLEAMPADSNVTKDLIRNAWDFGMTTQRGLINYWSEKQIAETECIIKTFITLFLSLADNAAIKSLNSPPSLLTK